MANKMKTMYDQGKALMAPEDSEAKSMAANRQAFKEATDEVEPKPALIFSAPKNSASDAVSPMSKYGAKPGEQRIDTSSMTKPLGGEEDKQEHLAEEQDLHPNMVAFHAEGGQLDPDKINIVGEKGPEEIVGDEVTPLEHMGNSRNPLGEPAEPEEEGAPADFGGRVFPNPEHMKVQSDTDKPEIKKPMVNMNADNPAPAQMIPGEAQNQNGQGVEGQEASVKAPAPMSAHGGGLMKAPDTLPEQPPAPPDPNQIIADQHAKIMKDKLDAAARGDLTGVGMATIQGNALNSATAQPENAAMPGYTGTERIGKGTPGEMQAQKDYQNKLADLDHRMLVASQVHTPEGKEELGYLQSEKALLQKMNPFGSAANHPGLLGKIEHGLAEAGNIAGGALVPNVMPEIPGSQANLNAHEAAGQANVAAGQEGALKEAQADKASAAPPPPKATDQLAQAKLTAQTRLAEIAKQLQHPGSPEQRKALADEQKTILAGQPELTPKAEDQMKEPVGDAGVTQHTAELGQLAKTAHLSPEETKTFNETYKANPNDSAAVADKKLAHAREVANMDVQQRAAQMTRDHADTQAESKAFGGGKTLIFTEPDGSRRAMSLAQAKSEGRNLEDAEVSPTAQTEKLREKENTYQVATKSFDKYEKSFDKPITQADAQALGVITSHQGDVAQDYLSKLASGALDSLMGEPLTGYAPKAMGAAMTKDQYDAMSPAAQQRAADYFSTMLAHFANLKAQQGAIPRNQALIQTEIQAIPLPYLSAEQAKPKFDNYREALATRNQSNVKFGKPQETNTNTTGNKTQPKLDEQGRPAPPPGFSYPAK